MELLIEHALDKKVYKVPADTISYETSFRGGAGIFECKHVGKAFPTGSIVSFKYDNANVFYGVVFTSRIRRDGTVTTTAYDLLRYLKFSDTLTRKNQTLDEFVRLCCENMGITVGALDKTELKLPKNIYDNKQYLDMIYDSMQENLYLSNYWYCIYDDFGKLNLTDVENMRLPIILGDRSFCYDYEYQDSIDKDTYNQVKIVRENKDTAKRDIYIERDGESIARWGTLQYFEKVNENYNDAQIKERLKAILASKGSETNTFTMSCIGDVRVRAGTGIKVELSDLGISQWALVDKAKHRFSGKEYTMQLDLILR